MEAISERSSSDVSLSLGRVLAALAWADGEVQPEEVECLKDMVLRMPAMNEAQWQELGQALMEPCSEERADAHLSAFLDLLVNERVRTFALEAFDLMVSADDAEPAEEVLLRNRFRKAVERAPLREIPMQVRAGTRSPFPAQVSSNRAKYKCLNHFGNLVEKRVREELASDDETLITLNVPDPQERKFCYGAALLWRVLESQLKEFSELRATVVERLQICWDLNATQAHFVALAARAPGYRDLNLLKLCRNFLESTSEEDRRRFMDLLFSVAEADGEVDGPEYEVLLDIGANLRYAQMETEPGGVARG